MEDIPSPPKSAPMAIPVAGERLTSAHFEAWLNIIRSYREVHPTHRVMLLYEDEEVRNLTSLFKMGDNLNPQGFKLVVAAPDHDMKDVSKLRRLLMEGAGDGFERFLKRDVYQVDRLFKP